jgi:hypothetical protein
MSELNNINVDILDNIIIGRVEPQIYAFTTETIPNYLKVGDTVPTPYYLDTFVETVV